MPVWLPDWVPVLLVFLLLNMLLLIYPALTPVGNENTDKERNETKFRKVIRIFIRIWDEIKKGYLYVFYFLFWPYLILSGAVLIVYYIKDFYPNLPQEIGGVKPKHAIFITDASVFSNYDQIEIFPDSASLKSGQTDTVLVYFYNDSKFVFKTTKQVTRRGVDAKTFEIGRSLIKSVKWLN